MSWRKYLQIVPVVPVSSKLPITYKIVFSSECSSEGKEAYHVRYRTEKHAEKGADRLYKRTLGEMEALLGLEK